MSGRHADLRIRIRWTQLSPGSFNDQGRRLWLKPIYERKFSIHLFNLCGCNCLQHEPLPSPPPRNANSTDLPTSMLSALYAAP